jgi:hypothetical protein
VTGNGAYFEPAPNGRTKPTPQRRIRPSERPASVATSGIYNSASCLMKLYSAHPPSAILQSTPSNFGNPKHVDQANDQWLSARSSWLWPYEYVSSHPSGKSHSLRIGLTLPWAPVDYDSACRCLKKALESGANLWNGVCLPATLPDGPFTKLNRASTMAHRTPIPYIFFVTIFKGILKMPRRSLSASKAL